MDFMGKIKIGWVFLQFPPGYPSHTTYGFAANSQEDFLGVPAEGEEDKDQC
jgi:hypothetical protein